MSALFLLHGFCGYQFQDAESFFYRGSDETKEVTAIALIDTDKGLELIVHFRVERNGIVLNLYEIHYKKTHYKGKPTDEQMEKDIQYAQGRLEPLKDELVKIQKVFGV